MPLFHHSGDRDAVRRGPGVPGLAEYAAAQGWQPQPDAQAEGLPFDGSVRERVHRVVRRRHGGDTVRQSGSTPVTRYHDAYSGVFAGRRFVVANAWTTLTNGTYVVSVCSLQVTRDSLLGPLYIDPRRWSLDGPGGHARLTGDADFDGRFVVHSVLQQLARDFLSPQMRALISERSDWHFWTAGLGLTCLCETSYASVPDVATWLEHLSRLADAIPEAALHPTTGPLALPGPLPPALAAFDFGAGFTGGKLHREELFAQFEAMSPEQQAEAIAQFQGYQEQIRTHLQQRAAERRHHGRRDEPR